MRKFEQVSYSQNGILPTRADVGSAGYDFYLSEDTTILPNETKIIKTDIKAQMEQDEVLLLFVRSSIGIKKHLCLANGTGVIDSTYFNNPDNEGNIMGALYNYGTNPVQLKKGDRFMQGVFTKYLSTQNDTTTNTSRNGGIGSSGE